MKGLMRAWLRASWHLPRGHEPGGGWEFRAKLLEKLAPDRSVIDVGGMWNVHGRAAFLAEDAGADRVGLFDAMEPTEEFEAERARRESRVEFFRGDLNLAETLAPVGAWDVVWCTGVLYHAPNPLVQIENLRQMTLERLVLGTYVIPEVPGVEQACVFYPMQSSGAQHEFARAFGDGAPRIGLTSPFDPRVPEANWWWGMSPSAVRGMLEVTGFSVVEEFGSTPFERHFVATLA